MSSRSGDNSTATYEHYATGDKRALYAARCEHRGDIRRQLVDNKSRGDTTPTVYTLEYYTLNNSR